MSSSFSCPQIVLKCLCREARAIVTMIPFIFCLNVFLKCHSGESGRCWGSRTLRNVLLILPNALTDRGAQQSPDKQARWVTARAARPGALPRAGEAPFSTGKPFLTLFSFYCVPLSESHSWHFTLGFNWPHTIKPKLRLQVSQLPVLFVFNRKNK